VQVTAGVGDQLLEGQKELLTPPSLLVKADQETLLGPDALAAPRCPQHRLVEQGAEYIAGGQDMMLGNSFCPGARLEGAYLVDQPVAQSLRVRVGRAVAQLAGSDEQG